MSKFFSDCKNNTLPHVSFITEAPPYDEHPPASSDHSSVLKFIESTFSLPALASMNHKFDTSTPRGFNY